MSEHGKLSLMVPVLALTLMVALPAQSRAAQGMIIITGECPYMVLDSSEGQILVKKVTGDSVPETGDILVGDFKPKSFATLSNKRTNKSLKVWVDMVDRHGNRAMARHTRYCR